MPLVNVELIAEVDSGDWGIGGQALTTEAVRAIAGGRERTRGWETRA